MQKVLRELAGDHSVTGSWPPRSGWLPKDLYRQDAKEPQGRGEQQQQQGNNNNNNNHVHWSRDQFRSEADLAEGSATRNLRDLRDLCREKNHLPARHGIL